MVYYLFTAFFYFMLKFLLKLIRYIDEKEKKECTRIDGEGSNT